jgi:hypothetical protein
MISLFFLSFSISNPSEGTILPPALSLWPVGDLEERIDLAVDFSFLDFDSVHA